MDNGQSILAPTPIVRITAEQLEYLIQRLRGDNRRVQKGWQYKSYSVPVGIGATVPVLTVNEARKSIIVSAVSSGMQFGPTDIISSTSGISVPVNTHMNYPLNFDDLGWIVTRAWSATNIGGVAGVCSVLEISGPPALSDM